jgi:hypothetical protein
MMYWRQLSEQLQTTFKHMLLRQRAASRLITNQYACVDIQPNTLLVTLLFAKMMAALLLAQVPFPSTGAQFTGAKVSANN